MNNTVSTEDMASFEVLHTQNHSSGSFPSGEYSFLPEVTAGQVPNGDISNHVADNFDLTNMQSALVTPAPDSSVEIHSQLLKLFEEKNSLEEKLNKTNSMMKEQMSTISAWREHMILSRDQQQQSLEKAKDRIAALEKEKLELSEKLENISKMNEKEKVPSCQKCTIFETALNNMLAVDSVEEGDSFCPDVGYFRDNLLQNLHVVCRHVETLAEGMKKYEEDKYLLKNFVLLLKFKIASLEGGNLGATVQTDEETGYEVVHQKLPKMELQQLLQDIEDLKKVATEKHYEVESLKRERDELQEKVKSCELKIQEFEMASKSQFELTSKKLEIESALTEKYKERCESLQQHIEEYQLKLDRIKVSDDHTVQELREDVQNLQDILKLEQQSNQNVKDKLSDVMLKCEKLQVDHDRVTQLLEIQSKDLKEKSEELNTLKEKDIKEYLEKIDLLTAQLFEMEEQMRESNAEVRRLEGELATVKEENESIPILKAQLDVYKTDFNNVELAKEAANSEVERLTNELKKYDKSNCPCSCKSQASMSRGDLNGRPSLGNKDQNDDNVCPFCNSGFKTGRLLERHIYRCHDDSDVPV